MTVTDRLARALTVAAALAVLSYPAWADRAAAVTGRVVDGLAQVLPAADRPVHAR